MNRTRRRLFPSWRLPELGAGRPRAAWVALAILGALLFEVWENSSVASMSVDLGRASVAAKQARAELDWTRSQLERHSSRAELAPVARAIGLQPADPRQLVSLPEAYLEPAETRGAAATPPTLLAAATRIMQLLVPDAAARGRRVN